MNSKHKDAPVTKCEHSCCRAKGNDLCYYTATNITVCWTAGTEQSEVANFIAAGSLHCYPVGLCSTMYKQHSLKPRVQKFWELSWCSTWTLLWLKILVYQPFGIWSEQTCLVESNIPWSWLWFLLGRRIKSNYRYSMCIKNELWPSPDSFFWFGCSFNKVSTI